MLYRLIFKVVFSRLDAELAHHIGMAVIRLLGKTGLLNLIPRPKRNSPIKTMGLSFNGPLGLAAGFDKNAIAVRELGKLGFSHIEVGTVTRYAQSGNPKPRLFRLAKDQALINRMGFNNEGADKIASRLAKLKSSGGELPVIGVNIGKSKITPLEDAVSDYEYSARILAPYADYLAVNVSSPNTPGLRSLQNLAALEPILERVIAASNGKPVLVKIAPDLADEDVIAISELVKRLKLAGVIATNTTISRQGLKSSASEVLKAGDGGLSGPPLRVRSLEILKLLRSRLDDDFAIISVGGVERASDVTERMSLGANLVQGYTGFIYQGPFWPRKLNRL